MCKKLFVLALVLGLTSIASAALVGHWELDGNGTDSSGYGNHGTVNGDVTPTTDRFGTASSAMYFDESGGNDNINVGNDASLNLTGAMTITAWAYLDTTHSSYSRRNSRILAKMDGSGKRSWSSGIEQNVGGVDEVSTIQVSPDGSSIVSCIDDATVPLDQWFHYAGVYNPGTSMEVYINGNLAVSLTTGVPASQYSANGWDVLIGNRPDCADCGWYGALDDVRLYNEVLSEEEIEFLMGGYTVANPVPDDEDGHVDPMIELSWDAPPSVPSPLYDVYLGTDSNFTGEAPVSASQSAASYDPDPDLDFVTTYFWRVDVNDSGEMNEGTVWSFTTQGLASAPVPDDNEINLDNNNITLTWTGESAVVSYDVYFGTDFNDVNEGIRLATDIDGDLIVGLSDVEAMGSQIPGPPAGPYPADLDDDGYVDLLDYAILATDYLRECNDPAFAGTFINNLYDPGALQLDTKYYWRVDEVFKGGRPKGNIWSFTTWPGSGSKDLGTRSAEMWEYEEWQIVNPTWSGNEFDVVADVNFTHTSSSSTHNTEMFYAGSNTWKFRFTGTKTGQWNFTTTSADPQLDGFYGSVTVSANTDPNAKGFLTNVGNKYAIMDANIDDLKGYRFNVYMNQEEYFPIIHQMTSDTHINNYIADAQQYNFDTIYIHVCNNWFDFGSYRWDEHSSVNPDPQTFAALENVIALARSQGMRVQLWAWGDEARRWTPIGVGGINGIPDQRVQRYIAARLGPLPGWTMGYGFDLEEWVTETQLGVWALYLHQHFGWQHMVWGRGRSNSELDAKSYSGSSNGGQPFSYDDAVSKLNSDLTRPHLYEERFTYMRDGAWTMENTRRALWDYTMAGGIGCWWGFYEEGTASSPLPPYPNPEQLATVNQFWVGRFLLDMSRDNSLTDGYCLKTSTNDNYVFYKESTSSVQMDLSGMSGSKPAVAVDTKLTYAEIDLGTRTATNQTWTAPYSSDWAIYVGN